MKIKSQNQTRHKTAGFTLVELAVATAVVSLMIIALSNLMIAIASVQRQNDHLALASRIAEAKIESLRNSHYNALAVSPPAIDFTGELPSELPSPRSAQVTVSEPTAGMKRLDVIITYREGPRDKSVELTALLGNIGISQ